MKLIKIEIKNEGDYYSCCRLKLNRRVVQIATAGIVGLAAVGCAYYGPVLKTHAIKYLDERSPTTVAAIGIGGMFFCLGFYYLVNYAIARTLSSSISEKIIHIRGTIVSLTIIMAISLFLGKAFDFSNNVLYKLLEKALMPTLVILVVTGFYEIIYSDLNPGWRRRADT